MSVLPLHRSALAVWMLGFAVFHTQSLASTIPINLGPGVHADLVEPPPPPGLTGPEYFVNITLKNGNTVLGTKKLLFDTGANATALSRADAKGLGLLDANGDPVAALDSGFRTAGENANKQQVGNNAASNPLTVMVRGKDKNGNDKGDTVTTTDKKSVLYPVKNALDVDSLLGTNIIKELPQETRTPDGTISFTAPPPPNPAKKVDMKSFRVNLIDLSTGLPVTDQLIANTNLLIQGASVSSPPNTTNADFFYVTGSPYTIISQGLANTLGAQPVGTFDLFGTDPQIFANLSFEGFLGSSNPGPFTIVELTSLRLPAESGGFLSFSDIPVLVNPVSSVTDNLFGTNVFANANLTAFEDIAAGTVQVGSVPEPGFFWVVALSVIVMVHGYRRKRKIRFGGV